MALFLDILTKVTLPIIVLVVLGWIMQPRMRLDVGSLNRLQVNIIMPAFLVHSLATGTQPLSAVWPTAYLTLVQFLFVIPLGWGLVFLFRMRRSLGPIVGLATAYANVGFFGIPVTQLAFGAEYLIHQSVVVSLVSILIATLGVWLLAPSSTGLLGKAAITLKSPLLPAVIIGLTLRGLEIHLPPLVASPLQMMGSIFTPLALYTLGAQVASSGAVRIEIGPQLLMLVLKFAIAPAITWGLAVYMVFPKDITDVLVVASSTPVGVLLAIFCAEYRKEAAFISAAVVISTALSPLFVTGWILLVRSF